MILCANFKIFTDEPLKDKNNITYLPAYVDSITFKTPNGKIRVETNDETSADVEVDNNNVGIRKVNQESEGLLIINLETDEEIKANDIHLLDFINNEDTIIEEVFISKTSDDYNVKLISVENLTFAVDDTWISVPESIIKKLNESISQ